MAPVEQGQVGSTTDPGQVAVAPIDAALPGDVESQAVVEPVGPEELNAWRRGFTPQAEIWNGRLAMLGLSVGLTVLLIARLAAGH
ncbi:chlorophyll a/b-binding protein [Synechococcus sp. CS-1328]|uniref:chlorophyll a/b-binding protein n=1 Tax=Synechococcus sp. CS-1328 TaxID=2847976 RepID=UPI00223AFDF5|nr:chlorophyll a/b-binding protein [Synechococcus sp. CS-1328]MCT0225074.1 high light inducible protein [Synechococcus sp. CS-1328]